MDVSAQLSSKGQLTVPKAVRDALGLVEGDQVVFRVEGSRAVLARTPKLLDLAGSVPVPARSAGRRGQRSGVRRGRLARRRARERLRRYKRSHPPSTRRSTRTGTSRDCVPRGGSRAPPSGLDRGRGRISPRVGLSRGSVDPLRRRPKHDVVCAPPGSAHPSAVRGIGRGRATYGVTGRSRRPLRRRPRAALVPPVRADRQTRSERSGCRGPGAPPGMTAADRRVERRRRTRRRPVPLAAGLP